MGANPPPTYFLHQTKASGFMASPTEPMSRTVERSYFWGQVGSLVHEHPDGSRCGVDHRDSVVLDDLKPPAEVGIVGRALVHDACRTQAERPVGDVAVAGDPSDIGSAPVDIRILDIEDPGGGKRRADAHAAVSMHYAARLSAGSGGVKDEERIGSVHGQRLAGSRTVRPRTHSTRHRGPPVMGVSWPFLFTTTTFSMHLRPAMASSAWGLVAMGLPRR